MYKTSQGWAHPEGEPPYDSACFQAGHFIGEKLETRWNRRGPVVWFELDDDGWPVFNAVGTGRPVSDVAELQSFFDYMRKK